MIHWIIVMQVFDNWGIWKPTYTNLVPIPITSKQIYLKNEIKKKNEIK